MSFQQEEVTNGLRRISPVLFGLMMSFFPGYLPFLFAGCSRIKDRLQWPQGKTFGSFPPLYSCILFADTAFYLHHDDIDSKLLFPLVAPLFATLLCLVITKHSSYILDPYMLQLQFSLASHFDQNVATLIVLFVTVQLRLGTNFTIPSQASSQWQDEYSVQADLSFVNAERPIDFPNPPDTLLSVHH